MSLQAGLTVWNKLQIDIRKHDDKTVFLDLAGDFDIYNTVQIKKDIAALVEQGHKHIVCNLEKVGYIDSSGIGALMVSLSLVKKHEGRFILLNVYESVKKVLEITKMTTFFEIFSSEDEILDSIDN